MLYIYTLLGDHHAEAFPNLHDDIYPFEEGRGCPKTLI